MALQSSGPIKFSEIQTEHGGSNPISLSEYYSADTGVPASGTISVSDFYGTSSTDVTLDPWDGDSFLGPGDDSTLGNISGINQPVTLNLVNALTQGSANYRVNGGSYTSFSNVNIVVNNGDTLEIEFEDVAQSGQTTINGSIQITNTTASQSYISISVTSYGGGIGP